MNDATMLDQCSSREFSNSNGCPLCGSSQVSDFLSAPDRFHQRKRMYHLMCCTSCGVVWLCDPPAPEEMSFHYGTEYYQRVAAAGETCAEERWQKQREVISRFKKSGDILDIGCSSGGFLGSLGDEWRRHGIEIAPEMAERACANTGAKVFVGDALSAPFAGESFDVITSFDVLEHVYQPRELVRKVQEWLKPGGIFYVMLPNIGSLEARIFGSYWYGLELPRHLFHFSPRSLTAALESEGFRQGYLETGSATYSEYSTRYLYAEALDKVGLELDPLATMIKPNIGWRIVRKLLRVTMLAPVGHLASLANAGASIEGVFVKALS